MPRRWFIQFIIKPVLCCTLAVLLGAGVVFSAEPDDSNLFVEAFNAFHQKDYLLTIEKLELLHQIFPDTPLRDISLLLMARAGWKSGDNERAAKAVNQLEKEFPESNLASSIEEELLSLAKRQKKGEKLLPTKQLISAAQKVRSDQLAIERAAVLKAEQERLARERAEHARLAREKAEAERRERERVAAEKAAKESIRLEVSLPKDVQIQSVEAGTSGRIIFELRNKGSERESFLVSSSLPAEYAATLTAVEKGDVPLQQVTLDGEETFQGMVIIRMPHNQLDGYKLAIPLKVISAKFNDVQFFKSIPVTASAPLVRAVTKPSSTRVLRGETVSYRVMVLNAGSQTARQLTVRVILPPQVEFVEASANHQKETEKIIAFKVGALETGTVREFNLNVRVKEDTAIQQELRCQVEVINGLLQLKETFSSAAAVVKAR